MAYSVDFRKRAVEFMDEGHTGKELYAAFKIYPSEVNKWRKLQEETGSLEPKYPKSRKGKIVIEELEKAVEKKPDAHLSELAKPFNCTKQAVFYALEKLKVKCKKNSLHMKKSPEWR
jgi:transposase